jgi:hypothetical protein
MGIHESTSTAVFFFLSLLTMIVSMFFTIGILVVKLTLFLTYEEAEIVGVFYGDESMYEAVWNT